MSWLRFLLLVGFIVIGSSGRASARSGEVVVSLALPSELLPTQICVRAEKLGEELAKAPLAPVSALSPNEVRFVPKAKQTCTTKPWACSDCKAPEQQSGGAVCWRRPTSDSAPESHHERELELELDNAGLESLRVEGADLVMKITFADSETVRVRSLGGAYYPGLAQAVSASNTLRLPLRSRCVERVLSYGKDSGRPLSKGDRPRLTSQAGDTRLQQTFEPMDGVAPTQGKAHQTRWHVDRGGPHDYWARGGRALLLVPEEGGLSHVVLERGGTTYEGTVDGPPAGALVLRPTKFSFSWKKSAFVIGRREACGPDRKHPPGHGQECPEVTLVHECPEVTLVRYGTPCTRQGDRPLASDCAYRCELETPIDLPTPIQFALKPPGVTTKAQAKTKAAANTEPPVDSSEAIVWQDDLRFPQAKMVSLPPSQERRVYLVWPKERRTQSGKEWDAIELTGPDGKTHRLAESAASLPVPGMQSPVTFRYQYVGRGPFQASTLRAHGDLLVLPEPSESRRVVSMGVHAHTGIHGRVFGEGPAWNPTADLGIVALILSSWELTFSATVTQSASALKIEDGGADDYSLSWQARLLATVGGRWFYGRMYFGAGVGPGGATRIFERDWSESKPWWLVGARARFGYELTRALGAEAMVTVWFPEQYAINTQDIAGPRTPTTEYGFSFNLGVGMQWADVF